MKKVFFALLTVGLAAGLTSCSKEDKLKADFSHKAEGLKVTFTNKSDNAATYLWTFEKDAAGKAVTSTEKNPVHTFSKAGTYKVQLDAINKDKDKDSHTETITVK